MGGGELNHDEATELLGAYALDAVEPEEGAALRRHLETCGACREELDGLRGAAAALGEAAVEAPAHLWLQISERLGTPAPPLQLAPTRRGARGWWRNPVVAAAAAVIVAAFAVLGWDVSRLDGRVANLQSAVSRAGLRQAADAAALAPGSRLVELRASAGEARMEVAITPGGQAYAVTSTLPVLRRGTYQLWGLSSGRLVSIGLLGTAAAPSAFRVEAGVTALMVTAEPAGGVPAPTTPVLVKAQL